MTEIIIILILFVWFFAYSIWMYIETNEDTISKTAYKSPKGLFTLWLWLWLAGIVSIMPNPWFLLAVAIEGFVGAAWDFRINKTARTVHNWGSYLGPIAAFGAGFVILPLSFMLIYLGIIGLIGFIIIRKTERVIYHLENLAALGVLGMLMFYYL